MIKPRLRSLPAALSTLGGEVVELARRLGYSLDEWQQLALNDLLATTGGGALAAFEAVLIVGRQNGKSLLGELYALHFALQGETVLFTTQRADTAVTIFRRLLATLPDELEAKPTFTNGALQIALPGGGVILFRTRGPRVGRGMTIDKLVVDECQICDPEHLEATMPALRTRPGAQVLYLGCAPNAQQNANCEVLHELRERAKRGTSESLCYLEWSAGFFDAEGVELQAYELTPEMLESEKAWLDATPATESGRIPPERRLIEQETYTKTGDSHGYAIEVLSVAIWPTGSGAGGPLSVEMFEGLIDPESAIMAANGVIPEVFVYFDVSTERKVPVCLAGPRDDGLLTGELVGVFGFAEAVAAISAIVDRADVDVRHVGADGSPENLDLLARLEREFVPKQLLGFEHASRVGAQACPALVDLAAAGRFRHRGQPELMQALRGAVVKQTSDWWVYDRRRSRADVSPLLALAGALWKADAELGPDGAANGRRPQIF